LRPASSYFYGTTEFQYDHIKSAYKDRHSKNDKPVHAKNFVPSDAQQKLSRKKISLACRLLLLSALSELNNRLEQTAQAIYKSWFVDFEPWGGAMPNDWREGTLGEVIELHDSKRIPLSGNVRDKMEKLYPYYGAASLMDYVDDFLFDGLYLLLGEDGTVITADGYPMLQYVWGQFWVNNHAHIISSNELSNQELI
jgi:type I restriction enzyme S subunit